MELSFEIKATNLGKRYNKEWIFQDFSFHFEANQTYVITGANGSGKSTLLQVLAGNLSFSNGVLQYLKNGSAINEAQVYRYLSLATPYLELFEEYTLTETLKFHSTLKPFLPEWPVERIVSYMQLEDSADKAVKYFSSGMKQKLKLALAIFSNVPLLLLDEPISNLDKSAIAWYQQSIEQYRKNRLTIVCSNQQQEEYWFCKHEIKIDAFK